MERSVLVMRFRELTYAAVTLLSFILLTGCSTTSQLIETGDIKICMTLEEFESVMFWQSDVDSDPSMENHGGSGYGNDKLFHGYRIAYGGNQEKMFVFDRRSVLIAITDTIGDAEQMISNRRILGMQGQQQMRSSANLVDAYRVHGNKADHDICYMIAENADPEGTYLAEAKLRKLGCVNRVASDKVMGRPKSSSNSSDPLTNDEIQGLLDLSKNVQQSAEAQDTESPVIKIVSVKSDGPRGIIFGVVVDNSGVAELAINGRKIGFEQDGRFKYLTYVPNEGLDVAIRAVDFMGLVTTESFRLERTVNDSKASSLTPVNPLIGPKQKLSRHRAALIIGVENYEASAPAQFASRDAQVFADYAREKLGIHAVNIKVLTDSGASEREILTALKVWLPTAVKPEKTDLYVFFAGHGMPTADGSSAYLVPYDGDVRLLEDTAISLKRFFDEIGDARPRSATFFFDNCYSGATRSKQLLFAARPLAIKVEETLLPDNYLVFAAGETDQIAGVEPEVKHGRFSYFVFKGLEGEADTNADGKISAGELYKYVRESVVRFSAGAQTPTMLGNADRWVLR